MDVVYEDKWELEDIFDCRNVLIRRRYSEEDTDKQVKRIVDALYGNRKQALGCIDGFCAWVTGMILVDIFNKDSMLASK
ncbi:MAG: hypothetical protein ACI4F8_02490 [Lachnospiraceae bacterium]